MRRLLSLAGLAALLVGCGIGCGPKLQTVECKVTLDGTAVEGATVVFHPDGESTKNPVNPTGLTDASGVCTMKTGNSDGVAAGTYKVIVTQTDKPKGMTEDLGKNPTDAMRDMAGAAGKPGGKPGGAIGGGPMAAKAENKLPAKYGDPAQTTLKVTVPTSGQVPLALTK